MPEWWTYRLSELLLFSDRTYYRMCELYHAQIMPVHVVTLASIVAILYCSAARRRALGRRESARGVLAVGRDRVSSGRYFNDQLGGQAFRCFVRLQSVFAGVVWDCSRATSFCLVAKCGVTDGA